MTIRAVTFDAYGTLVRDDDLGQIPRRIVADHGLAMAPDDVWRAWTDLYYEATQASPFRTLRAMEAQILTRLLDQLGVSADPAPYVDLFFQVTTRVALYPEAAEVLHALPVPAAVVSNADHEHVAAWSFTLPVQFVLISEAVGAYKPDRRVFEAALTRLGLRPDEVLHVGDSDVDDVQGAQAAGLRAAWVNRTGRPRRAGVPAPDLELRDLRELPRLLARL